MATITAKPLAHMVPQIEHSKQGARYGGHGAQFGIHPQTGAKMPQADFSENGSAAGNDPTMQGDYGVADTG
jgi:hypothetical protein